MHPLRIASGLALTLPLTADLATDYESERILRIETVATLEMETVDFSMERNGEPVEASAGSDATSEESRKVVQFDQILASEEGRPTKVRRTFDFLEGTLSATFGERQMDRESDCPLEGVSVEFTLDEGDVAAEVVEGEADEELLQGHSLALALDALLPDDEVEEGDSWELESEAIARALGLDVAPLLFRRSEDDGGGGRGGGGGGRRRGRMGGGGALPSLTHVEWEGEASLSSTSVDRDGVACAAIELQIEGSGEIPEPEGGFGRGRDRAPRSTYWPGSPRLRNENSISVEMEGTLYVALEFKRPLSLGLRGEVSTLREMERESDEFSMSMSSSREGSFEYEVTISEEKE